MVKVGAEAAIYLGRFLGVPAIFKIRGPKSYRDQELDRLIRFERTVYEARILVDAKKAGVPVPRVLYVDPYDAVLVQEYIAGTLLKDEVERDPKGALHMFRALGRYVARLHSVGICHGDLTTSNVIVRNGTPYLVDFGLASKSSDAEDHATDLHILLRSLESTHPTAAGGLFKACLEGYGEVLGRDVAERMVQKLREIRSRGRYVVRRKVRMVW